MAIAVDASTPAAVSGTGTYTTAKTTSAFSPPANALLVAMVVLNGTSSGAVTASITDSLSGTWSLLARENVHSTSTPGLGGSAELWVKYQTSAASNMTVSMTGSGATAGGYLFDVAVLTGAASTQAGVTAVGSRNSSTGAAMQVSLTPSAAGDMVFGAFLDYASNTAPTLLSTTANQASFADATNGDWYGAIKSTATTTTSATTYGYSTSITTFNAVVVQIQAASGVTNFNGTSTLTGAGTVASAASMTAAGASTLSGAGSVTSGAVVAASTTSTISGTGSVSAPGVVAGTGSGTTSGTGAITVGGVVAASTTSALNGSGSVTAGGVVSDTTTATLNGAGSITASGSVVSGISSNSSLTGSGSITTGGTVAASSTATLGGSGSVSAASVKGLASTASLTGSGAVTAASTTSATAALNGVGSVTASGSVIAGRSTTSSVAGAATVTAVGAVGIYSNAVLAGVGAITPVFTPSGLRDITLVGSPLGTRWATVPLGSRWGSTPVGPRWSTQPVPDRFTTVPVPARWSATPEV